jgi:hypothetical protein
VEPGSGSLSFTDSSNSIIGNGPQSVVTGDFNGDGILDLAVTNSLSNSVTILLGNGDGTFTAAQNSPATGNKPLGIVAGDFNGDGILDLAVANSLSNTVTILLGNGDGTFSAAADSPNTGNSPTYMAVGDFNGDGKLDLAVVNSTGIGSSMTILLGNGDGTFSATPNSPANGYDLGPVVVGDFNRDGNLDLAVEDEYGGTLMILLGKGDGTFNLFWSIPNPVFTNDQNLVTGDFNGDGNLDLAVVNGGNNTVAILLGNGDGTFTATPNSPATGNNPNSVAVGDFNGDGNLDLAVTNSGDNTVSILLGNGDGTFTAAPNTAPSATCPVSIAAGDWNGDGVPDLAVINECESHVTALTTSLTETATASVNGIAVTGSGTHTVVAAYPGDSLYVTSTSGTTSLNGENPAVATPSFSVTPGTYTSAQSVSITDSTPGARIYYTTNGATPTTSSTLYSGPITVSSTETIQAIATASGYSQSAVASAAYAINLPAATPTFSPAAGTYTSAQTVTISDPTPGATIYYTTNGTTPTTSSSVYSSPIKVSSSETFEAIAVAKGYSTSAVGSAAYTINLPAATPTFSPSGGTYASVQTVTLSDTTPRAVIYYTTNGSTPTTSSTLYSGPITVSSTETIQAIATASGYSQSAVATASYTINIPTNPRPEIGSMSPAYVSAGGTTFTLTANGTGFISGSTVYWGKTALATTYVSGTQLTASVPASDVANAGTTAITVQTPAPGGGVSNALQFEIDSTSASSDAPSFTTASATVAAGSTANYAVTLPTSVSSASVTCLNLPTGATCSYSSSTKAVTIATGANTPKGTYQVTTVFNETVAGQSAAYVLLPFLLLPLYGVRKKLSRNALWTLAWLTLLAGATAFTLSGCGGGGGGSSSTPPPAPTQQVTSSGVVTLTIQ